MGYYKQQIIESKFDNEHQHIIDLEIQIKKLQADNMFLKRELELCQEEKDAKKESKS